MLWQLFPGWLWACFADSWVFAHPDHPPAMLERVDGKWTMTEIAFDHEPSASRHVVANFRPYVS